MTRSPYPADLVALCDELDARGLQLSPRQVESLRARGVLPAPLVRHPGGGGSTSTLPPGFGKRAELVARLPNRSRTPANLALATWATGVNLSAVDVARLAATVSELLGAVTRLAQRAEPGDDVIATTADRIASLSTTRPGPLVRDARRRVEAETGPHEESVDGTDALNVLLASVAATATGSAPIDELDPRAPAVLSPDLEVVADDLGADIGEGLEATRNALLSLRNADLAIGDFETARATVMVLAPTLLDEVRIGADTPIRPQMLEHLLFMGLVLARTAPQLVGDD